MVQNAGDGSVKPLQAYHPVYKDGQVIAPLAVMA